MMLQGFEMIAGNQKILLRHFNKFTPVRISLYWELSSQMPAD